MNVSLPLLSSLLIRHAPHCLTPCSTVQSRVRLVKFKGSRRASREKSESLAGQEYDSFLLLLKFLCVRNRSMPEETERTLGSSVESDGLRAKGHTFFRSPPAVFSSLFFESSSMSLKCWMCFSARERKTGLVSGSKIILPEQKHASFDAVIPYGLHPARLEQRATKDGSGACRS